MHASPPFQMAVHRYGVWRAAAVLLVASTTAAVAAWLVHSHVMTLVWAVLCLLVSGSVAVLAHAWRLRPVSLRWDSQRWHLGPLPTTGHEPDAGRGWWPWISVLGCCCASSRTVRPCCAPASGSRCNAWATSQHGIRYAVRYIARDLSPCPPWRRSEFPE